MACVEVELMELRSARVCGICLEKCNNPVHGNGCEHYFCHPCMKAWTMQTCKDPNISGPTCPCCRVPYTEILSAQGLCRGRVRGVVTTDFTTVHYHVHGTGEPVELTVHCSWTRHLSTLGYIMQSYDLEEAKEWLIQPHDTVNAMMSGE